MSSNITTSIESAYKGVSQPPALQRTRQAPPTHDTEAPDVWEPNQPLATHISDSEDEFCLKSVPSTSSLSSCERNASTPGPDDIQVSLKTKRRISSDNTDSPKRFRKPTPILEKGILLPDGRLISIPKEKLRKPSAFRFSTFSDCEADIERHRFQLVDLLGSRPPHQHTGLVEMPRIERSQSTSTLPRQQSASRKANSAPNLLEHVQEFLRKAKKFEQ